MNASQPENLPAPGLASSRFGPWPRPPAPPHLLLLLPGGGGPDRRAALSVVTLVVVALALVRAAVATLPGDFLPPIRAIRQSSSGESTQTACAELADGNATCWGYSGYGTTGRPCNSVINSVCAPDEVLSLGTGRTVKQLDLGGAHGCAVLDNAKLKCWGDNLYFQLARDNATELRIGDDVDEMGDALPVVKRSGVALDVVQVATGYKHTCALLADETVSCWGWNAYGTLGVGLAENQPLAVMNPSAPVQLGAGFVPASIVAGYSTYVVSTSGGVKAWGPNDYGQLGIGDTADRGDGDPNNPSYNDMGDNLPAIEFPAGVEAIVSLSPGQDHGERGRGWTTGPFGGLAFGLL